jgi:hypothetical protein
MNQIINKIVSLRNASNKGRAESSEFYHFLSPISIKLIEFPILIPNDLIEFYENIGYAELFVDKVYGQGGIRIFNPYQSLLATQEIESEEGIELFENDLIIGDFIGDSDRILLSENKQISIIFPIYDRKDWLHTGLSFEEFFTKIIDHNGEKYWEI